MPERPRRFLPAHPDLDQQKKLAKELLRAFRAAEPEAVERVRAELPDKVRITLADAQLVLAREYGFPSWAELGRRIRAARAAGDGPPATTAFERAAALVGADLADRARATVTAGDARALRRLLDE